MPVRSQYPQKKERPWLYTLSLLLSLLIVGCDISGSDESARVSEHNFRESDHNWEPFFTNYPAEWEESMELTVAYRSLPSPLDTSMQAHFISAVNHSDDVMMLFRRQISGLSPNITYDVNFTVEFATEVPSGCAGIGGAPGEAVAVIAAASEIQPEAFTKGDDDYYLLNIQHEEDASEWLNNAVMGDIANTRECEEGYEFEIKRIRSGPEHSRVTADEDGKVWLLFGTRSGFEGKTDLYYTWFKAEFRE